MMLIKKEVRIDRELLALSPGHYKQGKYETIEVFEVIVEDFESYCLGNIIKYISRYKYKRSIKWHT